MALAGHSSIPATTRAAAGPSLHRVCIPQALGSSFIAACRRIQRQQERATSRAVSEERSNLPVAAESTAEAARPSIGQVSLPANQDSPPKQPQGSQHATALGAKDVPWDFGTTISVLATCYGATILFSFNGLDLLQGLTGTAKEELTPAGIAAATLGLQLLHLGSLASIIAFTCHCHGTSLGSFLQPKDRDPSQLLFWSVTGGLLSFLTAAGLQEVLTEAGTAVDAPSTDAALSLMLGGEPAATAMLGAAICVVAPAAEELMFRGFGLRSLLKFTRNEGTAIVGAALLFGLAHQLPLGETLTLSGVGVCLGLAYVKGGQNLVVPILAHSTYNLLALVVGAE